MRKRKTYNCTDNKCNHPEIKPRRVDTVEALTHTPVGENVCSDSATTEKENEYEQILSAHISYNEL